MKKSKKIIGSLSLALVMGVGLSGCFATKPLYTNNFSAGNDGTFGIYGTVTDNEDKSITINKSTTAETGSSTYFGEADKNFDWVNGGLTVKITMKINPADYSVGKGFNWTVSVNNSTKTADDKFQFITELSLYFRSYENGLRVGHVSNGSSDEINEEATKDSTSIITEAGNYEMTFKFFENKNDNDKIFVNLGLKKAAMKNFIFEKKDISIADNKAAPVTKDMISGLRYAWLSWMNADFVNVTKLDVLKNV